MKQNVITRFAPSPTGKLHVGNARTALINFLFAKKFNGKFILRMDDTDLVRSNDHFKDAIIRDLKWLGFSWDEFFAQSNRLTKYDEIKNKLISIGRLYPCFETQEELELKRKLQLSSGKPPIYDRNALKLSEGQIQEYLSQGRKPHYRFFINNEPITWNDLIKGPVHYDGKNISDPIVIREDGTMTYMLCSTVDDIDYNISHIIRGEDHVSNTAVQKQMFEALGAIPPEFAHLSLVKSLEDKISKRVGGFEIESLRDNAGYDAMAINSFFANIGTSNSVIPYDKMDDLISQFNIQAFSKSPTTYIPEELERLNHKIISHMEYDEALLRLNPIGAAHISKDFWYAVRGNLMKMQDVLDWWKICHETPKMHIQIDQEFKAVALKTFTYTNIDESTWSDWTKAISEATGLKGKNLFLPLRIMLTGIESGPEMAKLLPLIGYEEIIKRLSI